MPGGVCAGAAAAAGSSSSSSSSSSTRTLRISNLDPSVILDQLRYDLFELCKPFGEVLEVIAKREKRGEALVVFADEEAAAKAYMALQGQTLYGKTLRVDLADNPPPLQAEKV
ncbi:hypothetical protein, conserved [Eimeria tenella]|uniref:RRM domain-containing protein n=1 Tax=Eimeria tenella TaxID=5802 RepID=U6L392_EIMTE|nr:hypothetical protein, conserved [Eimeria tenella]CDJ44867.1 hypothetical protein, conserved [Eimeria tenella]|eukprot:XP_013235614.1 hypothetical protein, conserved [Eimeria tenella]